MPLHRTFAKSCTAFIDANGNSIDDNIWCCEYCDGEFETEREAEAHEMTCPLKLRKVIKIPHYSRRRQYEDSEDSSDSNDDDCYRCGRKGHWSSNCYARYHINGQILKN